MGYSPMTGPESGVDLRRKRFRALLEAGALGLEEVDSVVLMAKYIPAGGWEGWK